MPLNNSQKAEFKSIGYALGGFDYTPIDRIHGIAQPREALKSILDSYVAKGFLSVRIENGRSEYKMSTLGATEFRRMTQRKPNRFLGYPGQRETYEERTGDSKSARFF